MYPNLGKAYTTYAKSVKPVHTKMAAPPDPAVLFDSSFLCLIGLTASFDGPQAVQGAPQ